MIRKYPPAPGGLLGVQGDPRKSMPLSCVDDTCSTSARKYMSLGMNKTAEELRSLLGSCCDNKPIRADSRPLQVCKSALNMSMCNTVPALEVTNTIIKYHEDTQNLAEKGIKNCNMYRALQRAR